MHSYGRTEGAGRAQRGGSRRRGNKKTGEFFTLIFTLYGNFAKYKKIYKTPQKAHKQALYGIKS